MTDVEKQLLKLCADLKKSNPAIARALELFSRTTESVVSLDELKTKLTSGKKLRLKYGVDLTAPFLHLGHAVNLWMYREFQELGHKVVFLLGDATTAIGDPSGRNKMRPLIPPEEIERNAQEFLNQVSMVLRTEPEVLEVRRNSEWFGKMSAMEFLKLMSLVTHDKLMARDMFRKRVEEGQPIYEHELAYPILQGYDSKVLEADITVIGSDQLYNEMMGRFYQEQYGQKPQVIMTTVLTPGIDGKEKQSKSLGNYIALGHSPKDKFGRAMSIPDFLIPQYLKVYTDLPLEEVERLSKAAANDPMATKLTLAESLVARYHGKDSGASERTAFVNTFSNRQVPGDAPLISAGKNQLTLYEMLRLCFTTDEKSNSELRRLITQGAVSIQDSESLRDPNAAITIPGDGLTVQVGKRNWFRVQT